MAETLKNNSLNARKGEWVEIWREILKPGERAPQIPSDTQAVSLEMRVRGFLINEQAQAGETVRIRTRIGRELEGRLVDLSPRYAHSFGGPQPELLRIREELTGLRWR